MKLRKRTAARAAAAALAFAMVLPLPASAARAKGEPPRNSKGETYGTMEQHIEHHLDLIAALGTNGREGYIRWSETPEGQWEGKINTPEDAMKYMEFLKTLPEEYPVPLYDLEGNVIGEFIFTDSAQIFDAPRPGQDDDGYPVRIHVMTQADRQAFEMQKTFETEKSTAFLAKNNAAGTNGNVCAAFTAQAESAAIVLTSVPGASDYNVQLYEGKPGEGERVSDYATVDVNNGAYFWGLTKGHEYYFKVSSSTLPADGCTALYSLVQY